MIDLMEPLSLSSTMSPSPTSFLSPISVTHLTSLRTRTISFNLRRPRKFLIVACQDDPRNKLSEADLLEFKFGQMLGEDPKLTIAKVLFNGEKIGIVMGKTQKDAQQQVAQNALRSLSEYMDIFHLTREIEASEMSSLEAVINCDDQKRVKLEKGVETRAAQDDGGSKALERIYECLDVMDASTLEKRAYEILFRLGFTKDMQAKKTPDFSGGWRMKIALAQSLFMNRNILLLDDPTNHLGNQNSSTVWWLSTSRKLVCNIHKFKIGFFSGAKERNFTIGVWLRLRTIEGFILKWLVDYVLVQVKSFYFQALIWGSV